MHIPYSTQSIAVLSFAVTLAFHFTQTDLKGAEDAVPGKDGKVAQSVQKKKPIPLAVEAFRRKVNSLVLENIEFEDAQLNRTIESLGIRTVELDPDKKGVTIQFLHDLPTDTKISISATNVPLDIALGYIARSVGLTCKIIAKKNKEPVISLLSAKALDGFVESEVFEPVFDSEPEVLKRLDDIQISSYDQKASLLATMKLLSQRIELSLRNRKDASSPRPLFCFDPSCKPEFSRLITVQAQNFSCKQFLDSVCAQAHLNWSVCNGFILIQRPPAETKAKEEQKPPSIATAGDPAAKEKEPKKDDAAPPVNLSIGKNTDISNYAAFIGKGQPPSHVQKLMRKMESTYFENIEYYDTSLRSVLKGVCESKDEEKKNIECKCLYDLPEDPRISIRANKAFLGRVLTALAYNCNMGCFAVSQGKDAYIALLTTKDVAQLKDAKLYPLYYEIDPSMVKKWLSETKLETLNIDGEAISDFIHALPLSKSKSCLIFMTDPIVKKDNFKIQVRNPNCLQALDAFCGAQDCIWLPSGGAVVIGKRKPLSK